MSLEVCAQRGDQRRFPRVSGDEPTMRVLADEEATFSPRERG